MSIISMGGIYKNYVLESGVTIPVLTSIDLDVTAGEFVAIMGSSGSGKTTLMNLLGTLDRASSGVYELDGDDVSRHNEADLAHLRNKVIGFVFQGFNLLPRRTIVDNIALPLFYSGERHHERVRRAEYYLEQVGLSKYRNYFPNQLSGGQQQRIAIARALAGEPMLLLADEPTGNLDSQTTKDIMETFRELNREGMTIVLVTHEEEVSRYANRLVHVKDGAIIYDGPNY
jgi:putative ABC transport system ATP-binding protein